MNLPISQSGARTACCRSLGARHPAIVVVIVVGMSIVMSLLGCATAGAKSSHKERTLDQAVRDGVSFLVQRQNPNGSWGSFETLRPSEIYLDTVASHNAFRDATSALCCMALMKVAAQREDARLALERGINYLLTEAPELRATGSTFYHCWSQVYVLQCLARAILCPEVKIDQAKLADGARRWLKALRMMQGADGGWGYYDFGYGLRQPSGMQSTSFLTGSALWAMCEAEKAGIEVPGEVKRSAIAVLRRLRTPDKTFIYATDGQLYPGWEFNRPKGALGRSQAPNLALFLCDAGVTHDDFMLGLDRMFEEHHFLAMARCRPWPHEAWYYNSGYYFLYGYFNAAGVVELLPVQNQDKYWRQLVANLLAIQEADGSWWDFPFYGYYKEYGTAFALLALVPASRFLKPEEVR